MASSSGKDIGSEKLTAEGTFIWMYVESLKELRDIWLHPTGPEGEIDKRAFLMQTRFLINSIPDPNIRKRVRKREEDLYKLLSEDKTFMREQGPYIGFHTSLEIVSEVVEFLCNAFELTHIDITGPATSKQYRDVLIELPDMQKPEDGENGSTIE